MTKKDYINIADSIKENILYKPNDSNYKCIDVDLKGLIDSMSYVFKKDNNKFNSKIFKEYIMGYCVDLNEMKIG